MKSLLNARSTLAGETNAGAKNSTRLESMLAAARRPRPTWRTTLAQRLLFKTLATLQSGRVEISDGNARFSFGPESERRGAEQRYHCAQSARV